jgi:hypothetical protein
MPGDWMKIESHWTPEDHSAFMASVRASAPSMRTSAEDAAAQLTSILPSLDPVSLLGQLSFISTAFDPDAQKPVEYHGKPHYAEYVALLICQYVEGEERNPCSYAENGEVSRLTEQVFSNLYRFYLTGSYSDGDTAEGTLSSLRLRALIGSLEVIVPGYSLHTYEIARDLFGPFSSELKASFGFDISDMLATTQAIKKVLQEQSAGLWQLREAEQKRLRRVVRAVRTGKEASHELAPDLLRFLASLKEKKLLRQTRLYGNYVFFTNIGFSYELDPGDLARASGLEVKTVGAVLDFLTTVPGTVKLKDLLPSPTSVLRQQPILKFKGKYWGFLHWMLDGAIQPAIEHALRKLPQGVQNRYWAHRGDYVETKTLELLNKVLLPEESYHSLKYPDPTTGNETELDGLIRADYNLILMEAKAGPVRLPSRRGAPNRLVEDIKSLIIDAHAQATRAADYISSSESPIFRDADGTKVVLLNLTLQTLSL